MPVRSVIYMEQRLVFTIEEGRVTFADMSANHDCLLANRPIAKSSPNEVEEVGLPIAAAEKKAGLVRATATVVRSLQSGLTSRNREKWAKFASLAETKAGFSLQFRLHGGEQDIRTLGTGR